MRPFSFFAVLLLLAHPLMAGISVVRPEAGAKAQACCCKLDCAPSATPSCGCKAPADAPRPDPVLPASQNGDFQTVKSLAAPVRPVTVAVSDKVREVAAGISRGDAFAFPAAPIYILLHRLRN